MSFLKKLKQYWQMFMGVLLLVVTGAFLYERQRRKESDAIADNKEMLDKLNEGNQQLAENHGNLQSEEKKREEIRKEVNNDKADDSSDVTDFFRKR